MRTKDVIEYGKSFMFGDATNTANALTATIAEEVLTSYEDGLTLNIKIDETTDGAATLDVNGIGDVKLYLGSNQATQVTTQMVEDQMYLCVFNSSLDGGDGGFAVMNL